MKSRLSVTLLLAVLAVAAVPAAAALVGTFSGVVKDKQGQPLPGVSVTASGPVLQGTRTFTTKHDGTYFVPNMPPGPGYKVVFALSGFKTITRSGLAVNVNQDTQVSATLELADIKAEVVVTGDTPVVDVTQTNTSQNYDAEYLRKMPIGAAARTYQSIIVQAPGVVNTGNPNVFGASLQNNSFLIDGVNTTDPVTHTFSFNFNFDAVQEVNLVTSGYAAEYGRASGGVINVVTKSGGNEFSGSFDLRYTNNKMASSGDHFNKDLVESRSSPWGFTLGGPVLKDQLWFFGNLARTDNYRVPAPSSNAAVLAQVPQPAVRRFTGWNDGLKLSFTVSPKFNGFLNFTDSIGTIPGSSNLNTVRPEAASTQLQRSQIFNAKVTGVLTSSWLAELQLGKTWSMIQSGPSVSPIDTPSWVNRTQGNVRYDAWNNFQRSDRYRDLLGLNTTYFLSDVLGNHALKFGVDADRTHYPSVNYTTGLPTDSAFCTRGATPGAVCGATFTFNGFDASGNRIPYQQAVSERAPEKDRKARSYAVYLQDEWRPTPRLTVNLGVRWDRTDFINNADLNVFNFDKIAPRVSVAYDVLGNGKNVVRANYGQFYVDSALTLLRGLDTGIYNPYSATYNWNAATQKWVFLTESGGVAGGLLTQALVDGSLKPTWDEQINVAFEREITKGMAATATYVYKKTHDLYDSGCIDPSKDLWDGTTCTFNTWMTNRPGYNLDPSKAVPGVDYGGGVLKADYYAFVLTLEYRIPNGRGAVNASYVYSKSRGSIDPSDGQFFDSAFNRYPFNFVNRYGYMSDDARNRFKVFGSYQIPVIETQFGLAYNYRSGLPYTLTKSDPYGNTQYADTRGSKRTPVLHSVDVQLEKRIPINAFKQGLSVSVIGSVFNVLSSEQATSYFGSVDSPSTVNTPAGYQLPRSYEVGFRVDF